MEALRAIGPRKAVRYVLGQLWAALCKSELLLPPLRSGLLRLLGAHIGKGTVVHPCTLFNFYHRGARGLHFGQRCFIGNECLLDLADKICLDDDVTLAERVIVLTHANVGYASHPLQKALPRQFAPVTIRRGAFIGVGSTLLPGVTVGEMAVVGAGSLVREDIPAHTIVAGVPARKIRDVETQ